MGHRLQLFWFLVLLGCWWNSVHSASVDDKEWKQFSFFYDVHTKQPIPLRNPPENITTRLQLLRFGPVPCSCQDFICGCCAQMNIEYFDWNRDACMNMTYDPKEFSLEANMLWNDQSVWSQTVSGKNPPPTCIPLPVPYLPPMNMCMRMYDIYTPGRNIHMCMNWEMRMVNTPLLILEFDCFRMGSDGFANIKPNTPNGGLPEEGSGGEGGGEPAEGSSGQKLPSLAGPQKKPSDKNPTPEYELPTINLNVHENENGDFVLSNGTIMQNSSKTSTQGGDLTNKAPAINLNVTEFEDPGNRETVLAATEKITKINFNIDNPVITNAVARKLVPVETQLQRQKRSTRPKKRESKRPRRRSNKRKKKNRNKEKSKLNAPTLSLNVVEMSPHRKTSVTSEKRVTNRDSTGSRGTVRRKPIKLTYPEPEGRILRQKRSSEEERAKKPGTKKNDSPDSIVPPLNLDVLEIQSGSNSTRIKKKPDVQKRTTVPTTAKTTTRSKADIDININNLYLYLASGRAAAKSN